jgi:serine/threonine protein kinase
MVEWHTSNVLVRVRFPAPAHLFNVEKSTNYLELSQEAKEILQNQTSVIEGLVDDVSRRLGEGQTARVCFLGARDNFCLKVLKTDEELKLVRSFIPLKDEMNFLYELHGIDKNVSVPKSYFTASTGEGGYKVMMMERMMAYTVKDILEGRGTVPEGFNMDNFFSDLMGFVEKMHDAGIHHRDLHEGNIMVHMETGKPCVIDFGGAVRVFGEGDDPYTTIRGSEVFKLISDESMVKKTCKELRSFLTRHI